MTQAISAHMAAEGVDADLPTVHRTRLLADGGFAIAVTAVAAEAVLQLIDEADEP